MADVKSSSVSARITDYRGSTAPATAYLDFAGGDTVTGMETAIQAWITDLDAVTGGLVEECVYKRTIPLPGGLKSVAVAGVALSDTLSVNFNNAQDKAAYAFLVPALDPADITAGGPDVATGNSIDNLVTLMGATLAGTTGGHFTTNRDGNLSNAFNARIVTRTHRKQLQGKSSRPIA